MHAIFNHAIRWEWYSQNPITRIRQSAKRSRIPIVLSVAQIQALLENLREPVRTMVLVDVSTGLRIGELLALQWRDLDFENLEIWVTRSISVQHIGDCKTEASRKRVPMDAEIAGSLWRWRHNSGYRCRRTGCSQVQPRTANSLTGRALCIGHISRLLQRLRVFPARSVGTRSGTRSPHCSKPMVKM
jgi:integrase